MIHNRQSKDEKRTQSPDLISPDSWKQCCSSKERNGGTWSGGTCWDCALCRAPGDRVIEPGLALLPPAINRRAVNVEEMSRGFWRPLLPYFGKTQLLKCRLQKHSKQWLGELHRTVGRREEGGGCRGITKENRQKDTRKPSIWTKFGQWKQHYLQLSWIFTAWTWQMHLDHIQSTAHLPATISHAVTKLTQ